MISTDLLHVVDWRHGKLAVFRNDTVVGRFVADNGEFCEEEVALLCGLLKPGDVAVDVGANVGAMAVPFARAVGPAGKVIALEPQRLTHAALSASALLNDLTSIHAVRAAAGEVNGWFDLAQIDPRTPINVGGASLAVEGAVKERTPMIALDDLGLERCALLKVDAEGADLSVLKGARRLLATLRPAVYVEASRAGGNEDVCGLLDSLGYRQWWHYARYVGGKPFRGEPPLHWSTRGDLNLLALPAGGAAEAAAGLVEARGPAWDWRADTAAWKAAARPARRPRKG